MKIRLWEPCCSLEILDSPVKFVAEWTVDVDEDTVQRWQIVMQNYHRVQEEMRQAARKAH